ncbi:DUF2501 domain-containing protein [Neokomagataea tanensis]|nr:DUF2501 domain-containing protein [Neokomagataea tanensis]
MMKTFRLPALLSAGALVATMSLAACDGGSAASGQAGGLHNAFSSAGSAAYQSAGNSLTGSLGNLGNGLSLPNLSGSSTSNLTGVLKYCVTNNLASGSASSLLSTATQHAGISNSPSYAAGQQGILQTVTNQSNTQQQFSLSSLSEPMRQKACSLIQNRLQNLL